MRYFPNKSQLDRLADGHTHVPVWGELLADRDTPVSAFQKLHRGRHGCLLESAVGGERWGRYSFVITDPAATISARGRELRIRREGRPDEVRAVDDPLLALREILGEYRVAEVPGLPRFTGGLVGYISYDAVRWIERLQAPPPDDLGCPDMLLLLVDTLVVFDNQAQKLILLTHARVDDPAERTRSFDAAVQRIDALARRLDAPAPMSDARYDEGARTEPGSSFAPQEYVRVVDRAKEYIAAGDIIQVVLAQRFSRPTSATPFDIYRCLRSINPSPYLYFLDLDGFGIAGASPEVLVRLEDRVMTVRPIAGTHPRAANAAEDERLAQALLADPKERAEHVMLLDLGRNDVGRVAIPGTVAVTEQLVVERYSHVMHLVSNVQGHVAQGFDAIDVLRAAFPAGTLSGAPKVRAMQIIDELEPIRRGVYGGAVGYIGFSGAMDTAISIRTAVVKDGIAHVQAGAGVVADSDPWSEHEECQRKARAVLAAVEMAETIHAADDR